MDLSATRITEFSDRVVVVGSEKIISVAVNYGANVSGKSNNYDAFGYMSEYVYGAILILKSIDIFKGRGLSMAHNDRTSNRKIRELRKPFKVQKLGYYLIVTDTEATERCFFKGIV